MNVYLHNLRLTSRQQALQAQGFGPKMSQALQSSADDAENEYSHTKKKWIASIDSAIAAQRAIIGTDKQKDDDQEFLKQLEEQRTQILAIDPIPAATDNYKQYYADMNSADVDQLWNSNFGLRQAYMMYDCLSSMIVIEENFNELYMKIVGPTLPHPAKTTQLTRAAHDRNLDPSLQSNMGPFRFPAPETGTERPRKDLGGSAKCRCKVQDCARIPSGDG